MTETNPNSLDAPETPVSTTETSFPTVEVIDINVESTQIDWFTLAQSLRQQNQNLHKNIIELEQALSDAQQNLQIQTKRVRSAETLLTQQTEELNQTPEKVDRLVGALESSQQTIQQQQSVINHLSAQLEKTQGQLAYLERECALLQEEETGKTHQLLTAEKRMQELQTRLHRQQRYTLQYQSALAQFTDTPTSLGAKVIPLIPKTAAIQPWTDLGTETETQEKINAWVERSPDEENTSMSDLALLESNSKDSLAEFLTELENSETILKPNKNPTRQKNWSFSIIPSNSVWKKSPSKSTVDLPTFLREESL